MRRARRKLLGALAVLLVALAVFLVPTLWFRPWSIDHYYARVFVEFALRHPMLMTSLGLLDGTPLDFYSDKLDDLSPQFEEKEARFLDRQIAILHSYDRTRLRPKERLSYDVLDWFLTDQQQNNRFMFHDYPLNQLFGAQSEIPSFMMTQHPLKRPRDAESYVRRVARMGTAFDQVLAGVRTREARGVIPPRFVIREVLDQMQGFIAPPPRQNPLFATFHSRCDSIAGFAQPSRDALEGRLENEIRDVVYPAYRRMIAYEDSALAKATDDDGVWKLPQGDAYYDRCLQSITTTTLTADSIHALGEREVATLQAEMRRILDAKGYHDRDLAATIRAVFAEPRFGFAAGDSGRAQILAAYQAILDDARERVRPLFGIQPQARLEVVRVPAFKEATAPGAYYDAPSIGGKRPGRFFANLRDPAETRRPEMRTLAYHEGIPGHHFQLSIQTELTQVPFFRRVIPFTAYAEGWGLYAERVGYENGFQRDAYDSLGALQAELFRAVRLVVDTGIHREHWSRQQAIDYMVANTGMKPSEVVTEVERYIVIPGQACAYKVGQLELLAVRERARAELGPRFDLRRFHDVVLGNGALPLSLLERVVEEWVQDELKRPASTERG